VCVCSTLLVVADDDELSEKKNEDLERLQIFDDLQRKFEQKRRKHGNTVVESSSENENSSNDELFSSKSKSHSSGPTKLFLKEHLSQWPKLRYHKYRSQRLIKHGLEINYANIQTKEIKCSMKTEHENRKKKITSQEHLKFMIKDLPRSIAFVSLDPNHPIEPTAQQEPKRKHRRKLKYFERHSTTSDTSDTT